MEGLREGPLEVWVPHGADVDPHKLCDELAKGLVDVLLGSHVPLFLRSRWNGADLSLDRFCLMALCGGLLDQLVLELFGAFFPNSFTIDFV